jgi:tetratricopeptide (TPR) repeat protein
MAEPARAADAQGLSPAAVEATLTLAVARHRAGQLELAEALYDQVLFLDPANADALHLKAMAALARGAAREALPLIERACALAPESALYRRSRAEALGALGRRHDACAALAEAVALKPDWAEAHAALGVAHAQMGNRSGAKAALARATALDAALAEAWNNLGVLHLADKEAQAAIAAFTSALAVRPDFVDALNGLGVAETEAGRSGEAIPTFDKALAHPRLTPRLRSEILMNRAVALHNLGRWNEALSDLEAASVLSPDLAGAWRNRAKPLIALGRIREAEAACTQALALEPASGIIRYERAFTRLLAGDIEGGFDDYRARPTVDRARHPEPVERFPADLAGRRFRLTTEQGLGEHLFFLRYASILHARGAAIATEADAKLKDVLKGHPALGRLVDRDKPTPDFEPIPMGDLPFLVGGSGAPPPLALLPDASLCREIAARLATLGAAPYVALTWRAGIQDGASLSKIVPLEALAGALRSQEVTLISIQRAPAPDETVALARLVGRPIHDLSDLNDDLTRMLALLACVDNYVGVSNTNMHLRAGLGLPARVLIPHPPEFRWLAAGDRSPWFPGFTLYRADRDGWSGAMTELAADLAR